MKTLGMRKQFALTSVTLISLTVLSALVFMYNQLSLQKAQILAQEKLEMSGNLRDLRYYASLLNLAGPS